MKITYLGQAGLLFETESMKIIIDPYLSNSVQNLDENKYRRQPINEQFLQIKPDILLFTHNHLDHFDKDTVASYLNKDSHVLVLSPSSVWAEVRKFGGAKNNYVLFNNGTTWTEKEVVFHAVKAEHSDEYAIGIIITAEGKNYYITGDTLYNERVFASLPDEEIELLFLPVNGEGNNMNFVDGARFAKRVNAKKVVPIHLGLLDDKNAEDWEMENKILPTIYKEIAY